MRYVCGGETNITLPRLQAKGDTHEAAAWLPETGGLWPRCEREQSGVGVRAVLRARSRRFGPRALEDPHVGVERAQRWGAPVPQKYAPLHTRSCTSVCGAVPQPLAYHRPVAAASSPRARRAPGPLCLAAQLFQRVFNWLAQEVIVDKLANSRT